MSSSSDRAARVLRGRAARRARAITLDAAPHEERPLAAVGDTSVSDGWADGWAAGHEAGLAAAAARAKIIEAARRAELDQALASLHAAAAGWQQRAVTAIHDVEDAIVDAALALAGAVLDRELAVAADPGADALARSLRLAPASVPLVARLHPDDAATVAVPGTATPGRDLTIVPDPAVDRGGCILEAGDTTVDGRIEAALDRAREAMRG